MDNWIKPQVFIVPFSIHPPEELEQKFRAEVARRYGFHHGNIRKALLEAIQLWIDTKIEE